jgi:spermidine/putrescine transport system permease protein
MRTRKVQLNNRAFLAVAAPLVLLQVALFLVPLGLTFALTFQKSKDFRTVWTWNLANWQSVFSQYHIWKVMVHTLAMSGLTVLICLIIAFPVAYALNTRAKSYLNHVKVLIVFAFLTDAVLKTFGWVLFLDTSGASNYLLSFIGLQLPTGKMLFTDWATILGMVYSLLPFMIFTLFLSLDNIDRDLLNAAADAGASKLRAFWEVTVPLCRPGIWAGSVLVFLYGVGSFLEPKVLGGGKSPMAAELIRQTFETRINWPLGAALTLVIMVACIIVVLLFTRLYPATIQGSANHV